LLVCLTYLAGGLILISMSASTISLDLLLLLRS
jgi:hypothetical protein